MANYSPLQPNKQQIRLLDLQSPHSDPFFVEVKMRTVSLDSAGWYHALSYAWGDPRPTTSVRCDSTTPLLVTENLRRALRCVSTASPPLLLVPIWVDALCINQEDMAERSHQVGMMGQVYQQACGTVVWLGNPKNAQQKTVLIKAQSSMIAAEQGSNAFCRWSLQELGHLEVEVREILSRQWFSRRWVVQEYLLSHRTTFLLGRLNFSSHHFKSMLKAVDLESRRSLLQYGHFVPASDLKPGDTDTESTYLPKSLEGTLLKRLHEFWEFKHSTPHDAVYALHAISVDRHAFEVDYSQTTKELFHEVATHYISQRTTFIPLLLSALMRPLGEASWIPDWNQPCPNAAWWSQNEFGIACDEPPWTDTWQEREAPGVHWFSGSAFASPHLNFWGFALRPLDFRILVQGLSSATRFRATQRIFSIGRSEIGDESGIAIPRRTLVSATQRRALVPEKHTALAFEHSFRESDTICLIEGMTVALLLSPAHGNDRPDGRFRVLSGCFALKHFFDMVGRADALWDRVHEMHREPEVITLQ